MGIPCVGRPGVASGHASMAYIVARSKAVASVRQRASGPMTQFRRSQARNVPASVPLFDLAWRVHMTLMTRASLWSLYINSRPFLMRFLGACPKELAKASYSATYSGWNRFQDVFIPEFRFGVVF